MTEKMTLKDFFKLVPEMQKMRVFWSSLEISGTQDSLTAFTNDEFNATTVVNVEADNDKLIVWLEAGKSENNLV